MLNVEKVTIVILSNRRLGFLRVFDFNMLLGLILFQEAGLAA